MLFDSAYVSYDNIGYELCVLQPQRITESATRLDVAVNEDGKLQEIVSAFRDRREYRFGELEERYQLKDNELDPLTMEYRELGLEK